MDIISHDTLLFNVHDLVLLISVALSSLLAICFLFFSYRYTNISALFLGAIFAFFVVQSIDTIIIWSPPLRQLALSCSPDLFFLGGLGYWLQGPLLFWLVSSIIDPSFKLTRFSCLHAVPALVALILLSVNFYLLPEHLQVKNVQELIFLRSGMMDNMISVRYLLIIAYGGICLGALNYKFRSQTAHCSYHSRLYLGLMVAVISAMLMAAWPLLVHLTSNRISLNASNLMGLATNYLNFFIVSTAMLITLTYGHLIYPTTKKGGSNIDDDHVERITPDSSDKVSNTPPKSALIKHLEHYMEYQKPFLKHNINLQMLAMQLSIPERTLSREINQYFKQNFVEFINSYRIVEAKQLLSADVNSQKSMLEIMDEAGFNSKSSFNSTFKQQVGMTPSQFRKMQLRGGVSG